MGEEGSIFPFEFHLVGTPISLQGSTDSKERWRNSVEAAARNRLKEAVDWVYLQEEPLAFTVYYFPVASMTGDVDNIVKPIVDALRQVAYTDDQLIERVVAQKFEPRLDWSFVAPSAQLATALDAISAADGPEPVVYVRIDNDLSWRRL